MIIDQSEIDGLLAEAETLASEAAPTPVDTEVPAGVPQTQGAAAPPLRTKNPQIRRILSVQVPVIVRLAFRQMRISSVRDLSVGAIIEFEKPVETPLDLMVNNRIIGRGTCVKVGENFGLRVSEIASREDRVRSLGPE